MNERELAEAIRPLWEDARPLVPRLVGRRFASWGELIDEVEIELAAGPDDFRAEVLRAHPRLGEDPAVLERRSPLSWAEQGGDRLDRPGDGPPAARSQRALRGPVRLPLRGVGRRPAAFGHRGR